MNKPWKRRIPYQREVPLCTLGEGPTDLTPACRKQWDQMMQNEAVFMLTIERRLGATRHKAHMDAVWSQVMTNMHNHLRKGVPVDHVISYVKTVCRNEAYHYLHALARLAEDFIGDDEQHVLTDERLNVQVDPLLMVEVQEAIGALRDEMTERRLLAYVLTEAYELPSTVVGEVLGIRDTHVRDAVRHARRRLNDPVVQSRLRERLRGDRQLTGE